MFFVELKGLVWVLALLPFDVFMISHDGLQATSRFDKISPQTEYGDFLVAWKHVRVTDLFFFFFGDILKIGLAPNLG